jgi:hypothetical protein
MTSTVAALLGSIATAIAIFAGGLAVESYKRHRDRIGMALALAGAIDALLRLIEVRNVPGELEQALPELEAGRPVQFSSLVGENAPFQTITLSFAGQIGSLGDDLPFRVARFLTYSQCLQDDMERLASNEYGASAKAMLIRNIGPLWSETRLLGTGLVQDLRTIGGYPRSRGRAADRRDRLPASR